MLDEIKSYAKIKKVLMYFKIKSGKDQILKLQINKKYCRSQKDQSNIHNDHKIKKI